MVTSSRLSIIKRSSCTVRKTLSLQSWCCCMVVAPITASFGVDTTRTVRTYHFFFGEYRTVGRKFKSCHFYVGSAAGSVLEHVRTTYPYVLCNSTWWSTYVQYFSTLDPIVVRRAMLSLASGRLPRRPGNVFECAIKRFKKKLKRLHLSYSHFNNVESTRKRLHIQ
jgi:hypothetical protein